LDNLDVRRGDVAITLVFDDGGPADVIAAPNRKEMESAAIGGPRDLNGRAHAPDSLRDGGRRTSSIAGDGGTKSTVGAALISVSRTASSDGGQYSS
jgi:hypothetical protein